MTEPGATPRGSKQASDITAIHQSHVNVPEAELTELRRRINAARLPEQEAFTDQSQGVHLAMIETLARYWATEYDWDKVEARLNALPNFITEDALLYAVQSCGSPSAIAFGSSPCR